MFTRVLVVLAVVGLFAITTIPAGATPVVVADEEVNFLRTAVLIFSNFIWGTPFLMAVEMNFPDAEAAIDEGGLNEEQSPPPDPPPPRPPKNTKKGSWGYIKCNLGNER